MRKFLGFSVGRFAVAAAILVLGSVPGPQSVIAAETAANAPAPIDRAAIEAIIRDYLLSNPEVLLEAQAALEAKQKEEQRVAQLETIRNANEHIFSSEHDGIYGNPEAKYTLVEFFDYNCGYCKRAMGDMLAMTEANPDVRFVLKEFPILGPDSMKAHVVSMAFHKLMPEKYGEFHAELLGGAAKADEDSAMQIALSLGADEAALREAMKDPTINETFSQTYELANQLGISGTPSYVVGEEVIYGALGRQVLEEKVANLGQCGEATC